MPVRHRSRLVLVGLCVFFGVVYGVSMATARVTNDVLTTSLMSWRMVETGAPWFDGFDYSGYERPGYALWVGVAENGHVVGMRSPGPVAAGLPAYAATRLVGVHEFSLLPGSLTAVALTVAALLLLLLAIRPTVGSRVSVGAVAALGLTTPVWSVSADALYTHPVTLFGIAGMAWGASRGRWWLTGAFGAIALWGRLHTALVVALLGLLLAWGRRRPGIAVRVGLASAAGLALATAWGRWMYGTWTPAGGYSVSGYTDRALGEETTRWLDVPINHLGLWVAPDRGILVWTPALLVLLPAVVRSWRSLPDWSRHLAVSGIAYTVVQGQLNGFSGGSGFYGYRLTLELLVCLFPAFALSVPRVGRRAGLLLGPVLGIQFAAMSIGATGQGGMLSENFLWTQNSFVYVLGEIPALLVYVLLLALLGAAVSRALLRSPSPASGPHPTGESPSDVRTSDELDRI